MSENSLGSRGDARGRPKSQKGKQPPSESQPRGDSCSGATQSWPPARAAEGEKSGMAALPKFSLLSFSGPIEIASNLPGRARFRTRAVVGREAERDLLIENLHKIKGVNSVEVNLTSGSVLVHYQPEVITPEILFVAMIKLLDLESEFLSTPEPVLAREFREVATSLNRTVYELTGGIADLHTVLLISLALFGLYMFRRDRLRAFPGGFTLLWWAYISLLRETGVPN